MRVQKLLPLCYRRVFHLSELCFFLCEVSILVPALCASQGPREDGMEQCLLGTSSGKVVSLLPLCRWADCVWRLRVERGGDF